MFEFNLHINDADYIRFNEYHVRNTKSGKKLIRLYTIVIPVLFLILAAVNLLLVREDAIITSVIFGVFSLLSAIFGSKLLFYILRRSINRMKADGKLPYQTESTVTFNDDGVSEVSAETSSTVKYSAIERVCTDNGAVYIYISQATAILLPASTFADDGERTRLLEFLSSAVPNKEEHYEL